MGIECERQLLGIAANMGPIYEFRVLLTMSLS